MDIKVNFVSCDCRVSAMDCGEQAACWISNFLNRNCRLIEHHKQDGRTCKLGGKHYIIYINFINSNFIVA